MTLLLATISATDVAGASVKIDAAKFLSDLACREAIISGSQGNLGAIRDPTPESDSPLKLFELAKDSPLHMMIPPNARGLLNDDMRWSRMTWSRNGDFVLWDTPHFEWLPRRKIMPEPGLLERQPPDPGAQLLAPFMEDPLPEHFDFLSFAAHASLGQLVALDTRTGKIVETRASDTRWHSIARSAGGRLARFGNESHFRLPYLDIFNGTTSNWEQFSPSPLPPGYTPLLFRESPRDGSLEAAISWLGPDAIERIGLVKHGSQEPETIAASSVFDTILLSADRTRIYGHVDASGKFHRISSEDAPLEIAFWLDKLEQVDGVQQFYPLANARYAYIKTLSPSTGAEVFILERNGDSVKRVHTLCSADSPVARVEAGENALLFFPKNDPGDELIVYLHDGPFVSVGRSGDWQTDLLSSSGNPVVAVNYIGSLHRALDFNRQSDLVEIFGGEVERAIGFAKETLGGKERKVIFVGDNFGSLVGYSAILSRHVAPAGFAIFEGYVNQKYFDFGQLSLTQRAFRDLSAEQVRDALDAALLIANDPQLRLRIIHAEEFGWQPLADVAAFTVAFNALGPMHRAELTDIQGTRDSTLRKREYEELIEALNEFLSGL